MEDVTLAEIVRRVDGVERRVAESENRFVLQAVYTRDMTEIRHDIAEIKDSQKWAMRLIAGQFVALIVGLLIWVVQQVP